MLKKRILSAVAIVAFISTSTGLQSINVSALDGIASSDSVSSETTTPAAVQITTGAAVTIEEARGLNDSDEATVSGVVSYNDNNTTLHIQDSTGGIAIYDSGKSFTDIKVGDEITVTGIKKTYNSLIELIATRDKITVTGNPGKPEPKLLTIADLNKGGYDSQYVRIENAVIAANPSGSNGTLTQDDDILQIYKLPTTTTFTSLLGKTVNIEGTMGITETTTTPKIKTIRIFGASCTVTKAEDVIKDFVIEHTPAQKASLQENLVINAKITGNTADSVKFNYRTVGSADYTTVDMVAGTDGNYTYIIPKENLAIAGLEYYIVAKNDKNNVEKTSDVYKVEITSSDGTGPVISDILPAENSNIKVEALPQISASIQDATGIAQNLIKIYLDNTEVTASATITTVPPDKASITYTPVELKDGIHKVKIEVSDIAGNATTKEWSFTKGEFKHLFGQLHSHTNISDGTGSLDDAYEWAKDNGADYFAVTDHSNWFDNDTEANISDGSASKEWTDAHVTADKYNDPGKFTSIYGYEMTWSGSTGGWGHINTFDTPGFETRTNSAMDLENYYKTIQKEPQSISQLNHPGTTFGDFADFSFYSKEADKYVNLIEVGNGEGPIGGSGYFPSYDYYTRALDKGWHVAPTNNQDNHKGKWFTANTARTVVLATDNSRDSIYDALRNKRVYASEDTDMKMDFTVNGEMMGSSLGKTDDLDFKINVNDPEADDTIKKISIIANGGVEVTSKEFDSANVDWNFTLSPEYSYYYAKVVQADGDILVTAPVWVGDSLSVGLQDMTVGSEKTLPGENVPIKVGVYNNGTTDINNIKVDFYKNEVSESNKIGATTIDKVTSSGQGEANFNWIAPNVGEYKIYAKVTMNVDGKDKVLTTSAKVSVVNPSEINKVVIDGAHYNQYVSGNYAGKYTATQSLLQNNNSSIVVVNKDPITDETLKGVKLLILTNPQSTDKSSSNLFASKFEASEIAAIKKYVDNGGNLILSTVADYGDGTGEYSKGKQMNPILEAIGSEMRINDDEVIDDKTNGGQNYRLYLNKYSSPLYNLIDGVKNDDDLYSCYSSASVILADGASGSNVDFIVKGHETTTTLDSDKQGDNVPVDMGDVSVLGAEKLQSGGKVVVSGSTFISDFEIDSTNGDKYSNKKIVQNVANWMLPKKEVGVANIGDLKIDANNDGVPDLLGQKFTIEGYVTAQSEAVNPKNAFFEVIYVQDETGGTCVFGVSNTPLKVGQRVKITGKVDQYQGENEIQISDEDNDVKVLDGEENIITPISLSTKASMLKENGGKLVQVQGKVINMDSSNLYVDDGTGVSRVYVEGYIWDGINSENKGKVDSSIKIGDTVSAIGIASMDPEGARLRVRNTSEIKLATNTDTSPGSSKSSRSSRTSNRSSGNDNANTTVSNIAGKPIEEVAKSITDKITGEIKGVETITTKSGGSAEIVTITKDALDQAKVITTTINDEVTVNAKATDKVYTYIAQLGSYVEVNSSATAGTITFTANSSNIYVVADTETVGTIAKEGWNQVNETWYYINSNGEIQKGWYSDNGIWYNFTNDGNMNMGWLKDLDGKWYYLDADGSMRTGWLRNNDGKWYFFKALGEMAFNENIDGYELDNTGAMLN